MARLGEETLDGVDTQVVSFFENVDGSIWFRAWISADGLVRRSQMRAQGHLMDVRYYDYDAPFNLEPPAAAQSAAAASSVP